MRRFWLCPIRASRRTTRVAPHSLSIGRRHAPIIPLPRLALQLALGHHLRSHLHPIRAVWRKRLARCSHSRSIVLPTVSLPSRFRTRVERSLELLVALQRHSAVRDSGQPLRSGPKPDELQTRDRSASDGPITGRYFAISRVPVMICTICTYSFDLTHVFRIARLHVRGTESLYHKWNIDAAVAERCETGIHLSLHSLLVLSVLLRCLLMVLEELLLVRSWVLLLGLLLLSRQASTLLGLQLHRLRSGWHLTLHRSRSGLWISRLT